MNRSERRRYERGKVDLAVRYRDKDGHRLAPVAPNAAGELATIDDTLADMAVRYVMGEAPDEGPFSRAAAAAQQVQSESAAADALVRSPHGHRSPHGRRLRKLEARAVRASIRRGVH